MESAAAGSAWLDEAIYQQVVAVLDSGRALWWQAEQILALMCRFEHIGGQRQDAGDDKPFDLRALDDRMRIDVKTQQGNELDVKKEKPGKQFAAWANTGKRFIPLQLVLDSLSQGWYVVPGIPRRTADVVLDPTVTSFDAANPLRPFMVGRCLLQELRDKERYAVMVVKLKEALEVIEEHREAIQAQVDEEHQRYLLSVAENALDDPWLMDTMTITVGRSDEAMGKLAKSDEAMGKLAKSDEAMTKLAQSDEAMSKLAKSDEAMSKLAKSDEAIGKLIQHDEAIALLAKSPDFLAKVLNAATANPDSKAVIDALLAKEQQDDAS